MNSCWPVSPSLFMPCTQSFGPRSGKRDPASSLILDSCQLAPLPEEVIKYGHLRPVSQYLLFPSCVSPPTPALTHSLFLPSSLSTLPLSIFPEHHPSLHGSSFTSCVFEQGVGRGGLSHRDEGKQLPSSRKKSQHMQTLHCSLCLHPSCFSVQERHCSWKYFQNMSA